MNILIGGCGKLGYFLARTIKDDGHLVKMIEKKESICQKISNALDIAVVNGDATLINVLAEAGCKKADVYIALTGSDQDNLISCQLAKKNFGVRRTIARVNNPKNVDIFNTLGVDTPVSGIKVIADLIEQEVDFSDVKTLMLQHGGKVEILELIISGKSPACGKKISELEIKNVKFNISAVFRGNEIIIPNGNTVIKKDDYITVVALSTDRDQLEEYFI